ncbi:MAG: thioredoxin-dependent thiol peroxidase [Wenzhouxiangellaceae bacterium]
MKRILTLIAMLAAITVQAAETPQVGDPAPDFRLQDQYGEWHQLEDYRGQWLALYFYPKDDTPGCTTEACNFRDNIYAFKKIGAEVVGVSVDDVESHKEFSDKYKIPFTILADADKTMAKEYGVLRNYAVMKIASRQSFLIDPQGHIAKHYEDVDPDTHTQQVLDDLESMMAAAETG